MTFTLRIDNAPRFPMSRYVTIWLLRVATYQVTLSPSQPAKLDILCDNGDISLSPPPCGFFLSYNSSWMSSMMAAAITHTMLKNNGVRSPDFPQQVQVIACPPSSQRCIVQAMLLDYSSSVQDLVAYHRNFRTPPPSEQPTHNPPPLYMKQNQLEAVFSLSTSVLLS